MIPKYKQKENGSWQNVFFFVILGLLILIFSGFLAVSNYRISQKKSALNSRLDQLKSEIQEIEAKKQELQAKLNQSSQEDYLEKEAREKFNLQKPGEEVVVVLPADEGSKPEQTEKPKQWWNPLSW